MSIELRSSEPLAYDAGVSGTTFYNQGPDSVYYGTTGVVSSSSFDGQIVSGANIFLTDRQFFVVAPGGAQASVTTAPGNVVPVPVVVTTGDPINIRASPYNAVGDAALDNLAAATDNTAAIQAALDAATAAGVPLYIPPGDVIGTDVNGNPLFGGYKCTGTLTAEGANVMIDGCASAGPLYFTTTQMQEYNWLVIKGPGASAGYGGYLRNVSLDAYGIYTQGVTNATEKVGVTLDQRIQFTCDHVSVGNAAIGFEMLTNCFGSHFNCCNTSQFNSEVGININGGAGNDITYTNCWFGGGLAAVVLEGNMSGHHFRGGQLTAGQRLVALGTATPRPDLGVIVTGVNWRALDKTLDLDDPANAAAIGGDVVGLSFDGVSFENYHYMWLLRTYGLPNLAFRNCSSIVYGDPAIGIWDGSADIAFEGFTVVGSGTYSSTVPIGANTSSSNITESGTLGADAFSGGASNVYSNSSMLVKSQAPNGHATLENAEFQSGMMFRNNAGTYQKSTDWGATWSAV